MIGRTLAHYRVVSAIGAGGMGEVYRATDTKLGRDIALKVLPPEMALDPERLARFRGEARAVAALNHPHIVTMFSVEEAEGIHFLTMELVEGQSLDRQIPPSGLPVERIIEIGGALADALSAAHERGIMHRDLKPANVMVTNEGRVKVLDFGLAKDLRAGSSTDATLTSAQTQVGVVMGTPAYMSPEQVSGRALDHRTDIFSLGVLLHEMCTGQRPFAGQSSAELTSAILRDNPPSVTDARSDLPSDLARIIRRCLEKDPRHRLQTARDVSNEFRDLARQASSRPSSVASSTSRPMATPDSGAARARIDEGFWVAVLPFKAADASPEINALADGLSEEIITSLSRFSYLRVIARGLTAKYSTESGDIRAVGKELGARYVMGGSLRQAGPKLRVAVQLVDAATGAQMWAETYERAFRPEAIFEIQDEIGLRIVSTVADQHGVLPHSISNVIRNKPDDELGPSEAVLRVFSFHERMSPEEHASVRALLETTVQRAPAHSDCWAMLATLYSDEHMFGFSGAPHPLERARAAAQRAIELAPSSSLACQALAQNMFFRKEWHAFRPLAERTIGLNRADGALNAFIGMLIALAGDWDRGCAIVEAAVQLNPHHPSWYGMTAVFNAYRKRDYRASADAAMRINMPGYFWGPVTSAAAFGQLGERERARKAVQELLAIRPDFATAARGEFGKWFEDELAEHYVDGLRKAGLEIESTAEQSALAKTPASGSVSADEGFWVAVLPFKYSGGNAELKALVEGLTEDIVTGLSRFPYLRVIANSSTARYVRESADVRATGKELGARYVMEGSLRQAGTKLRLAVQLVDAVSGTHLWAENYERTFNPEAVFELQDDLVPRIVSTLADSYGVLPYSMSDAVRSKAIDQLTPYEALLRAIGYGFRITPEEHAVARTCLERAVQQAPGYADGWAMLSILYADEYGIGFNSQPNSLGRALQAARKATDVAASNAMAQTALAKTLFFRKEFQAMRSAAEQAISLNPMDGAALAQLGSFFAYSGDWESGCDLLERAMQLNPRHPGWYWFPLAWNAYRKGDYRGALNIALKINLPGFYATHELLAMVYGQLGERDAASQALSEMLKLVPDFGKIARTLKSVWFASGMVEHVLDGLRKAGLEILDDPTKPLPASPASTVNTTASGASQTGQGFRVVVLPFRGASGDPDLEALSDGLSEDITTGLSRFPYLQVIAHNSAMAYKDRAADVRTVGRELGARYVMEGSIRKRGRAIRVSAQLIDAMSGTQLWAEAYDRKISDEGTFQIQDDLTDHIVTSVADGYGVLVRSMAAPTRDRKVEELSAAELVLRYYAFLQQVDPQEHGVLRAGLERALERDPNHATAWACLSSLYQLEYFDRFNRGEKPLERAREAAWRAVKIDPACQMGWKELAAVQFLSRDFTAFRETAERAMALNPRDGTTLAYMAIMTAFSGDWERGLALAQRAVELNRHHPGWYHNISFHHHYRKGEYEAALQAAKRINMPEYHWMHLMTAAACGMLGRQEEARHAIESLRRYNPTFLDLANVREDLEMWDPDKEEVEKYLLGLQKAGLKYGSADSAGTEIETKVKSDPTSTAR